MTDEPRTVTCPECHGQKWVGVLVDGVILWKFCPTCNGVGRIVEEEAQHDKN